MMDDKKLPKIYSRHAILGFSIFFSTLFGGILLYQNLISAQKKTEAYIVLAVSVVLTIITIIIGGLQENPKSTYAYVSGLLGGCLLSYFFVPKYFPDEAQYSKKSIWIPLLVGLAITAIFVFFIIYSTSLENG
jgi:uncharacterized membrane protein YidH (DUF202 family)